MGSNSIPATFLRVQWMARRLCASSRKTGVWNSYLLWVNFSSFFIHFFLFCLQKYSCWVVYLFVIAHRVSCFFRAAKKNKCKRWKQAEMGKGPNCANEEKRGKKPHRSLSCDFRASHSSGKANILGCLFISFGKAKEHARFFEDKFIEYVFSALKFWIASFRDVDKWRGKLDKFVEIYYIHYECEWDVYILATLRPMVVHGDRVEKLKGLKKKRKGTKPNENFKCPLRVRRKPHWLVWGRSCV